MTILVEEETSVVMVASVAAEVVVDMVAVGKAIMDLVMMVVMEEVALVTLEEAEAMEVLDRVMETRTVAMVGVAAMTAITMEEVEAALAVVVEAILEVVEATMILAITTINFQILDQLREETLEAEVLALMVVVANTLLNHETKVAMVVPASAAMAVAGGSNYSQEQSLTGEESQRSDREATGYNRFVNSVKHSGGRAWLLQRRHVLDNTHVYG
ncbi:hypothetical protein STEG23_015070 [Scotinomys teguina]